MMPGAPASTPLPTPIPNGSGNVRTPKTLRHCARCRRPTAHIPGEIYYDMETKVVLTYDCTTCDASVKVRGIAADRARRQAGSADILTLTVADVIKAAPEVAALPDVNGPQVTRLASLFRAMRSAGASDRTGAPLRRAA